MASCQTAIHTHSEEDICSDHLDVNGLDLQSLFARGTELQVRRPVMLPDNNRISEI